MKNIGLLSIVLAISIIACGVFSGGDSEEAPTEIAPSEVAGAVEPTEEDEPPVVTEPPTTTESPKSPEKDVPIEPKPTESEVEHAPAVTEMPISSREEGLPDNTEEIYFPYEVEQYQGGVDITVLDFRAYEYAHSETENFIGIIMNTGTVEMYNMTVYITALDENGEELASTNDLADLGDFPVGRKIGFTVSSRGDGFPEETDRLLIAFRGWERPEWAWSTQEFEILSAEGKQEPHTVWGTVYDITLTFRSTDEYDTRSIYAAALLYNGSGRIIGACHTGAYEWGDTALPPGREGEISFSCKFVYGIVDHFELTVQGSQVPED